MPRHNQDDHNDILSSFVIDDEDQSQINDDQNNDTSNDEIVDTSDENDQSTIETDANDSDFSTTDTVAGKTKVQSASNNLSPRERLPSDAKGNLVDKNGKILIPAGEGRAFFEKVKTQLFKAENDAARLGKTIQDLAPHIRRLQAENKQLIEMKTYSDKLGLDRTEEKEAVEIFAKFKTDPQNAIKQILTKAHLAGVDLTNIGISGPLDPAEVARHILAEQERSKPKQQPIENAEPPTAVEREASAFLQTFPEANNPKYIEMIAEAKKQFPNKSFGEIWYALKTKVINPQVVQRPAPATKPVAGKPPARPVARNATPPIHNANRRGIDLSPRAPSNSFKDIGRELLADLKRDLSNGNS